MGCSNSVEAAEDVAWRPERWELKPRRRFVFLANSSTRIPTDLYEEFARAGAARRRSGQHCKIAGCRALARHDLLPQGSGDSLAGCEAGLQTLRPNAKMSGSCAAGTAPDYERASCVFGLGSLADPGGASEPRASTCSDEGTRPPRDGAVDRHTAPPALPAKGGQAFESESTAFGEGSNGHSRSSWSRASSSRTVISGAPTPPGDSPYVLKMQL